MHVESCGANISKAMPPVRGNNKRLPRGKDHVRFFNPHLGFPCYHCKHFLDRMPMCRSSLRRRYPLLENAKLHCTVAGRNVHSCFHSRSPLLTNLLIMGDHLH